MNRRPQLRIVAPDASMEEAAAVIAALEHHMRERAPALAPEAPAAPSPWARAGLLEATGHAGGEDVPWQHRARPRRR